MPELVIWNPYNADLSYFNGAVHEGYTFAIRLMYDEDGESTIPFFLRVGAGIEWEGQVNALPTQSWSSWISNDIEFFNLQTGNTDYLQSQTFTVYRLRVCAAIYFTSENYLPGPDNAPLPDSNGLFADDDKTPPPSLSKPTISRSAATLYLGVRPDDIGDRGPVTLIVY